MRTLLLVSMLGLCGLNLGGCGGATLTHIDIDGSDRYTVPGGNILDSLLGSLGFEGFTDMDITDAQELENQGVEDGDIRDVRLVSFELEVVSPEGASIDFIDEMTLTVEAPGLESVRLAHLPSVPAGATEVSFDVDDVDLTPYVVSESMTLNTDVRGSLPEQDTTIEGRYLLDVGVTVRGAVRNRDN